MATSSDVMDDMLAEAALLIEIEQPKSKRARTAGNHAGKAGVASAVKPIHAISGDIVSEAENGGNATLEELSHKVA